VATQRDEKQIAPLPRRSRSADPYTPVRGCIVHVRQRQYLVEDVSPPPEPGQQTRVELVCLDDDAQGRLTVLWELELGAKVLQPGALETFQDEVIDRLVVLNAKRAEEERLAGASTTMGKAKGKPKGAAKGKKVTKDQLALVDEEEARA
jgi:hypothetical protein